MTTVLKQRLDDLNPHPIERTTAFHEYISRNKLRNKRSLECALKRILRVVKHCTLDELTGVHIEHGISILTSDGYSRAYIDRSIRALRSFLNWSMKNRFVIGNATEGVVPPRDRSYSEPVVVPEPTLTKIQEHVLANCTVEDVLLWAFLRAGCRISEPCAVRKKNLMIDPASKTAYAIVGWKTDERKIKLPMWSYRYVLGWLTTNAAVEDDHLVLFLKGTALDLSIPENDQRRQMDHRTLIARDRINDFQTLATGERTFSPKDMRSTFITKALRANPNKVAEIAKFVGNTPDILIKNYAHLFDQTDFSDQMG
jgi:site-specific recombinase XerC